MENKFIKYKNWYKSELKTGIINIKCDGWSSLEKFLNYYVDDTRNYIWRGQRCDNWPLLPRLDRKLEDINKLYDEKIRKEFLKRFKFAARNRYKEYIKNHSSDDDWWAFGQHYGLSTPLLDWTLSPYIATFFAFEKIGNNQTKYRTIYGMSVKLVQQKSKKINDEKICISFIDPTFLETPRIINQRGLFTKSPDGIDIENWLMENISNQEKRWVLIKILVPDKSRDMVLKSLERMAISSIEMFPDIIGSCDYCNMSLEIKNYCQNIFD